MYKLMSKYLLVTFCSVLVAVMSIGGVLNNSKVDYIENRNLEPLPDIHENTPKEFFEKLSSYVNDHFGGRRFFLDQEAKISAVIKSSLDNETKAKIMKGEYAFFMGSLDLFFAKKFKSSEFEEQIRGLSKNYPNIPIYAFIASNKTEIYPELVIDSHETKFTRDKMVERLQLLNDLPNVHLLDLKPSLLDAKAKYNNEYSIYPKNDTHWTGFGAYQGYKTIIKFINDNSNFDLNIKQDIKEIKSEKHSNPDLAKMLNLLNSFIDNNTEVIFNEYNAKTVSKLFKYIKNVPDTKNEIGKKRAFIIHDSFVNATLHKYLSETFNEAVYLWDFDFEKAKRQIDQVKPDLIIIEIADRHVGILE